MVTEEITLTKMVEYCTVQIAIFNSVLTKPFFKSRVKKKKAMFTVRKPYTIQKALFFQIIEHETDIYDGEANFFTLITY